MSIASELQSVYENLNEKVDAQAELIERIQNALKGKAGGAGTSAPNGREWVKTIVKNYDYYSAQFFVNIVYENGFFVVTTPENEVLYSEDGVEWIKSQGLPQSDYIDTYSCDGVIYLEFNTGFTYASTNPRQGWIQINTEVSMYDNPIFFNGIKICYGTGGIYYSVDGFNWNLAAEEEVATLYIIHGVCLAGCYDKLLYSLDGKTWNQTNLSGFGIYDFSHINQCFVVGTDCGLYYSLDGRTWTISNYTESCSYFRFYKYNEFLYYITNQQQILRSSNGMEWEILDNLPADILPVEIEIFNKKLLLLADYGEGTKQYYLDVESDSWIEISTFPMTENGAYPYGMYEKRDENDTVIFISLGYYLEDDQEEQDSIQEEYWQTYYSFDGINWNLITGMSGMTAPVYGKGKWVGTSYKTKVTAIYDPNLPEWGMREQIYDNSFEIGYSTTWEV